MNLSLLFSAAALILSAFSFIYLNDYLKRRTGAKQLLEDYREEVELLKSEIDAITDRDAALVEDRVKALRALLDDVDRRLGVYLRELERGRSGEAAYAQLGRLGTGRSSRALRGNEALPLNISLAPLPPSSAAPLEEGSGSSEAPPPPAFPRIIRSKQPIEPKPPSLAERAAELAKAGFSTDLIAAQLGATVAEVELAIAVSGKTGPSGA